MSKRTGILIGGGVVLVAAVLFLVISLSGKKTTDEPIEPPEKAAKPEVPARQGTGLAPRVPVDRKPDAGRAAAAPPADSGVVKPADDAQANRFGTASKGDTAHLARVARVKQRDMYRTSIADSTERIEKLTKVIERLRKSGGATPEQLTQVQRQLQQTVDAMPRLKAHLQKIEEELKADQEKSEREKKQPEEGKP